jgi:hypothetical protein
MDPRPLGHRSLHHIRDVTYDEDASQIRTSNGPQGMATLRNLTTGITKNGRHGNIAGACRYYGRNATRTLAALGLARHDQPDITPLCRGPGPRAPRRSSAEARRSGQDALDIDRIRRIEWVHRPLNRAQACMPTRYADA